MVSRGLAKPLPVRFSGVFAGGDESEGEIATDTSAGLAVAEVLTGVAGMRGETTIVLSIGESGWERCERDRKRASTGPASKSVSVVEAMDPQRGVCMVGVCCTKIK
jgi:hypothetical protein